MNTKRPIPEAEYLREIFNYDPSSGLVTWKRRPDGHFLSARIANWWNTKYVGKVAGTPCKSGHLRVGINGLTVMVHRVVWKIQTGDDVVDEVDHMNSNPSDNRWINLRLAVSSDNRKNRKVQKTSRTGIKGVGLSISGRYTSSITTNGGREWIGTFDTAEEAHAAYCRAAQELHGEFWSPG